MRIVFYSSLFLLPFQLLCQEVSTWQIEYKLHSALTIHPDNTLVTDNDTKKVSLEFGGGIELKRSFNKRFFLNSGISLSNQTFNVRAVFNQSKIPPPRQAFTRVLIFADQIKYQNLEFLVKPGIYVFNKKNYQQSIYLGYAQNVLLSAFYDTGWDEFTGYYKKMTKNGSSFFVGMQHSFKLNPNFCATIGVDFSIQNKIESDPYITLDHDYEARRKHNYCQLYFGLIQQL